MTELTKKQWEDLVRFAGVDVEDTGGVLVDGTPALWVPSKKKFWQPLTDWNDFGPLWVKLSRWGLTEMTGKQQPFEREIDAFDKAILKGTDQDIMLAGCQLGAAIGKTMRQEIVG